MRVARACDDAHDSTGGLHARAARHKLEAGDDDELLEDRVESTGLGGAPPLRVDRSAGRGTS